MGGTKISCNIFMGYKYFLPHFHEEPKYFWIIKVFSQIFTFQSLHFYIHFYITIRKIQCLLHNSIESHNLNQNLHILSTIYCAHVNTDQDQLKWIAKSTLLSMKAAALSWYATSVNYNFQSIMLYFIAAEVVKQSEPQSKLCVLLFGRRDLVNNCEKGHFLFFEVFHIHQVVFYCSVDNVVRLI